jgi:hypothetical protein
VVISSIETGQNFTIAHVTALTEELADTRVELASTKIELADTKSVLSSVLDRLAVTEGMSSFAFRFATNLMTPRRKAGSGPCCHRCWRRPFQYR